MVSNDWLTNGGITLGPDKIENPIEKHCREVVDLTWNHAKRCRDEQDEVMNAALGLVAEAGEVADIVKKSFFHKPKDRRAELLLELGDVMYYYAKFIDLYGFTLEEILEANKVKLFERYNIDAKKG